MFSSLRGQQASTSQYSPTPTYVIPCSLAAAAAPTPASTSSSPSSPSSSPSTPQTPPPLVEHLTHSTVPPAEFGSPRQLVRFDTECILIPEPGSKYYKQLAKSRSRSRSLTRPRKGSAGHVVTSSSGTEDEGTGRSGKTRLVVQNRSFKLPLWSSPTKERVKINFKVPLPVLERGRRSRSPSPVPPSPSILRDPHLPSIHISPIPVPSSPNPVTPTSPPHSPTLAHIPFSSSSSPQQHISILHNAMTSQTVSTTPLRPCCPDCLPSLTSYIASCTTGSPWEEKYTKGAAKRMRKRSSSVASYASGDGSVSEVWMGEGGVISPTVMGGVAAHEGLALSDMAKEKALPPVQGLDMDKPLPVPQDLLKITESEEEEEDLDVSPLAPCKKPIAVDEVDKKIRERCSLENGASMLPQGGIGGPCASAIAPGACGESDDEDAFHDAQEEAAPCSGSSSSSSLVKDKTPSGTATPTHHVLATPTRPTFLNTISSSPANSSPGSHSGTSTPTPHPILSPQAIAKSNSGSSTPTKSILKNASQGGGRILSDAQVEAREERRRIKREERMRRELEEKIAKEAKRREGGDVSDDDDDEELATRRVGSLKSTLTVQEDYVLVGSQSSESEAEDRRKTHSRSSSRSSIRSSQSSTSRRLKLNPKLKEWDMSLPSPEGGDAKGKKRYSYPLPLPFGPTKSFSAPNSPARSTFPAIPSPSHAKLAFTHSVSPPSPSSPHSPSSFNKAKCRKNGSTSSLNHVSTFGGKKYDLSGCPKTPLYCPSVSRRAASDGEVPSQSSTTSTCVATGDDEMLFPLPKNRTPSPGAGGSKDRFGSTGSLGVSDGEEAVKPDAKEKEKVKSKAEERNMFDEEFALPSRRTRASPNVTPSPVQHPAPTSPTSQACPPPPSSFVHPSADSAPPPSSTRNLGFLPRRGPTSGLPSIPGSRPTSSHSRTFSDSHLVAGRSSTSSSLRRPVVNENSERLHAEEIARALAATHPQAGNNEGEEKTRVLGDATNTPPPASGKLKRTPTAPVVGSGSGSPRGGARERSVSESTVGSIPSTPTRPPRRGASGSGPGARESGGSGGKRKPSFSLRMKHLKEVGADVWRGVGSIGSGVGRIA